MFEEDQQKYFFYKTFSLGNFSDRRYGLDYKYVIKR